MSPLDELPVGTVTFLFTDIEGSTRLLKQLRERYGEALEEHQRILRAAFAAQFGHEIDTQGDSFFVAFRRAEEAGAAPGAGPPRRPPHEWAGGPERTAPLGTPNREAPPPGERVAGP